MPIRTDAAPNPFSQPETHAPRRARRVFITVAEVSGDKHAAQLIRSLREIEPGIAIEGLGGPEMAAAGAVIHRDTVNKAAMGLRGALRAFEVYRLLRWTRHYFDAHRPDLWVGVDSPSMNFHFARIARERGIPSLQYVAPQLWAWASWRMKKLRRWVDRVACILPFEEKYFAGHGVPATFVGHPLFDELPTDRALRERAAGELKFPVIGLLPGSREGEAKANFGRMMRVAEQVFRAFPEARFLVPTTPATHPVVERLVTEARKSTSDEKPGAATPSLGAAIHFEKDAFDQFVPQCDLCITVSGTATLHVAGFRVPMIVVYHGSPLLWNLVGRWLIRTRTYALVNVLSAPSPAGRDPALHTVPEFVPWYGPVDAVADLAIDLLRHPEKLAQQQQKLDALIRSLDHPGASTNVARLAIELMDRSSGSAADAAGVLKAAHPAPSADGEVTPRA